MVLLRKFLYLDESALADYLSVLEVGLRERRQTTTESGGSRTGGVDAKIIKGSLTGTTAERESADYADTAPSRFNRLLDLATADEESTSWIDLQTLEQLDDIGFGAMVNVECEVHVPDMVRTLASGEIGSAFDMLDKLSPFAEAFDLSMDGMPGKAEREGLRAVTGMMSSDLVFVGEDDSTEWRIAGKLSRANLRDPDIDGYVRVVGKVSRRWKAGEWKPLIALPGASLVPRAERRAMERTRPEDPDDDSYLEGPAVLIDVLAIWR